MLNVICVYSVAYKHFGCKQLTIIPTRMTAPTMMGTMMPTSGIDGVASLPAAGAVADKVYAYCSK